MVSTPIRKLRMVYLVAVAFSLLLAACASVTPGPQSGTAAPATELPSPAATMVATEPADPGTAAIFGWVFHDVCAASNEGTPPPAEAPEGCVPAKEVGLVANGVKEDSEPVIPGVTVRLGAGACPSTGLAETKTIETDISYSFTGLKAGTYCVSIDAQEDANKDILLAGWWTAPIFSDAVAETSVTLGPGEAKYDQNFGWDYQFQPAPGDTSAGEEIMDFEAQLVEALGVRDYPALEGLMGDEFSIVTWMSEGQPYNPAGAIEQLSQNYLGADTELKFLPVDDLLGAAEVVKPLFGEEAVKSVYVQGWGVEGKDEAVVYIGRDADGSLVWRGVLVAPGGFAGERVPEGGLQIAPDTFLTEVDYVQALSSAAVYRGDPSASQPEETGMVEVGQQVKVTGIRDDERWWRVVCPDDKLGDCWMSADEAVTRPYVMMPGTQIAPETVFTELSYLQALQTVPVYGGEIGSTDQVGEIAEGQTALITGASEDGNWWRVICPDDSFGMCWVTVDPEQVNTLELPPR